MAVSVTLAHTGLTTIDLNNQSTHFVMGEGFNLGQNQTTWDELPSYAGTSNVQRNVQRKHLIPVTIPMYVTSSSVSALKTSLDTLWIMVDACDPVTKGTLTVDSETYNIVYSTRPDTVERDNTYELQFRAYFTLVLMREPS
jgi:hypothetical protein